MDDDLPSKNMLLSIKYIYYAEKKNRFAHAAHCGDCPFCERCLKIEPERRAKMHDIQYTNIAKYHKIQQLERLSNRMKKTNPCRHSDGLIEIIFGTTL